MGLGRIGASLGLALAVALLAAGCGGGEIGEIGTSSREVSGFDEIVLLAAGDVEIEVTGTESLTVEAEEEILPQLTTEVVDGRLELGTKPPGPSTSAPIEYRITAAQLDGITILGAGDFSVSGIDSGSFTVTVNGAGEVTASGSAEQLTVTIAGAGSFNGEDLTARTGSVSIPGSGSAVVKVSDDLDVRIPGAGNVEYIGNPSVTESIPGVGSVSRR